MGFSVSALEWLNSQLSQRTQQVKFRNVTSKIIYVQSGIPQSSHLIPVLFTLFINDLHSVVLCCKGLMYADEVKIFNTPNSVNGFNLLRADFCGFYNWCCNIFRLSFTPLFAFVCHITFFICLSHHFFFLFFCHTTFIICLSHHFFHLSVGSIF